MVNTLAIMNLWLKEDHQYKNKGSDKIAAWTGRFVTINAEMEIIGLVKLVDPDHSDDDK
jgi:hypothetical protein